MTDWFCVSRSIFEHPIFANSEFSEREAWLWLVAKAAWRETSHRVGSHAHIVERGDLFVTLRQLQAAWKWGSDGRVRRFLDMLENQRMVQHKNDAGKTQISICNYDKYQDVRRKNDADMTQETTQPRRKNDALKEQVNKIEEDNSLRSLSLVGSEKPTPTSVRLRPIATFEPSEFDEFWKAYPKRNGSNPKDPALKKFEGMCRSGVPPGLMIEGARRYATAMALKGQVGTPYVAQAVVWLNQKRWQDDYENWSAENAQSGFSPVSRQLTGAEILNREAEAAMARIRSRNGVDHAN